VLVEKLVTVFPFIITDTEGSFMVERVYQIAEGCISDIMEYFPHHHHKASSGKGNLQPEGFLSGIYYFRICSYTEQIAVINYLEKFLGEHKDVIFLNNLFFKFDDLNCAHCFVLHLYLGLR
jgi:RAD51-like protein 2